MTDVDLVALAAAIDRAHKGSPSTKELTKDYRLMSLEGEKKLAELLGVEWEPRVFDDPRQGDGGKDLVIYVNGTSLRVDAKTTRRPDLGMLVKVPKPGQRLRADIYVSMGYPDLKCYGWQWRAVVEKSPVVDKGHDIPSHHVEPSSLRRFEELYARLDKPQSA